MSEEEERENGNHIPVGTMQILNNYRSVWLNFLWPNKSVSTDT